MPQPALCGDPQNAGNELPDRPCVRQTKFYRQYESGNAVKALLGQDQLLWDVPRRGVPLAPDPQRPRSGPAFREPSGVREPEERPTLYVSLAAARPRINPQPDQPVNRRLVFDDMDDTPPASARRPLSGRLPPARSLAEAPGSARLDGEQIRRSSLGVYHIAADVDEAPTQSGCYLPRSQSTVIPQSGHWQPVSARNPWPPESAVGPPAVRWSRGGAGGGGVGTFALPDRIPERTYVGGELPPASAYTRPLSSIPSSPRSGTQRRVQQHLESQFFGPGGSFSGSLGRSVSQGR